MEDWLGEAILAAGLLVVFVQRHHWAAAAVSGNEGFARGGAQPLNSHAPAWRTLRRWGKKRMEGIS